MLYIDGCKVRDDNLKSEDIDKSFVLTALKCKTSQLMS